MAMTLIELPTGRFLPPPFEGTALEPIPGLRGCYEGLSGWAELQWRDYEFDDWFASRERDAWWRERVDAISRGDEQGPIDPEQAPPDGYGIGDSPEQILNHPSVAWVHADPRQMILVLTEVRREDQPEQQGWRFHKHGAYIGEHNVEWEYLAEQDGRHGERIDAVWMYNIIQVIKREHELQFPADF